MSFESLVESTKTKLLRARFLIRHQSLITAFVNQDVEKALSVLQSNADAQRKMNKGKVQFEKHVGARSVYDFRIDTELVTLLSQLIRSENSIFSRQVLLAFSEASKKDDFFALQCLPLLRELTDKVVPPMPGSGGKRVIPPSELQDLQVRQYPNLSELSHHRSYWHWVFDQTGLTRSKMAKAENITEGVKAIQSLQLSKSQSKDRSGHALADGLGFEELGQLFVGIAKWASHYDLESDFSFVRREVIKKTLLTTLSMANLLPIKSLEEWVGGMANEMKSTDVSNWLWAKEFEDLRILANIAHEKKELDDLTSGIISPLAKKAVRKVL